jgi:hypothetical protein
LFFLFYAASRKEANLLGTRSITRAYAQGFPLCTSVVKAFGRYLKLYGPEKPSLNSPGEGQGGHIVVLGSRVHEVLHALQDAPGKISGR